MGYPEVPPNAPIALRHSGSPYEPTQFNVEENVT